MTEVAVEITSKSSRIQHIDLVEQYSCVSPEQICRTCTYVDNRNWQYPGIKYAEALADGLSPSDLNCAPDRHAESFGVAETTSYQHQIFYGVNNTGFRTRAFVDTCGHTVAPKCRSCDRFVRIKVEIPYVKTQGAPGERQPFIYWTTKMVRGTEVQVPVASDGSTVYWWKTTIGGHCSIGPEGITKGDTVTYCDPKPRKLELYNDPSCANCNWADNTGEHWQHDYLTVNENATLTPWERYLSTFLVSDSVSPAMAYGIALKNKQSSGVGRRMWYRARLEEIIRTPNKLKYKVNFIKPDVTAIIADGDPRFEVHLIEGSEYCGIEIAWPHHRLFGLDERLFKYPLIWPSLPPRIWVSPVDLSVPTCPRCKPGRACYYHAKAPVRTNLEGDISFVAPENAEVGHWELSDAGKMTVEPYGDSYRAVDLNGNPPEPYGYDTANASVFRMWLPTLLDLAFKIGGDKAKAAIHSQYVELVSQLERSNKALATRPSWYVNSGIEPSKPYCSHPLGLDLRKVFADSFGSERTDLDFDTGAQTTMQVEEELRVGFRQHNLTPQRLHEEIISADIANPKYDPKSDSVVEGDFVMPSDLKVTLIDGLGGLVDESGEPIVDPNKFIDYLNEQVVVSCDSEGETKITRRMQLFGYDLSRGYFGSKSSVSGPPVGSTATDVVIFGEQDDSSVELGDIWTCPDCESTYPPTSVNFWDPKCPDCNVGLVVRAARQVYNPRSSGGIGSAMAMSNERMRQYQRMQATLCPHWRLKGNVNISLADVSGPDKRRRKTSKAANSGPKIVKVGTPDLTPEQMAANAAYKAELDIVIDKRTQYLLSNPQTSQEDLLKLFPAPNGTIYEPKAVGSAAKMG